ncbi:hypothetical protein [Desulforegula conservatrix]|uniref:hypothetical protein n=1 Tax=Desulforegula conservatrix TaxID=153026 RepID=UPI000409D26C|nr:hypothetical protein [Desulforegula conservatrix]
MCDCKQKMEEQLIDNFKKKAPKANDHAVVLKGYTFTMHRESNSLNEHPFMPIEASAQFTLKNGKTKMKIFKEKMLVYFCPFCGEKLTSK